MNEHPLRLAVKNLNKAKRAKANPKIVAMLQERVNSEARRFVSLFEKLDCQFSKDVMSSLHDPNKKLVIESLK